MHNPVTPTHDAHHMIDKVVARAHNSFPVRDHDNIERFIRQYLGSVSWEDMAERQLEDLYGAVISHWNLVSQRLPQQVLIRVQNPTLEEHGWQSTHTVVEVIQKDMPFLVDSVRMALNRHGLTVHLIIHPVMRIERNAEGRLIKVFDIDEIGDETANEACMYFEVDQQSDPVVLQALYDDIARVLADIEACVQDWQPMRERLRTIIGEVKAITPPLDDEQLEEDLAFLEWLDQDHFTFIGYREYQLEHRKGSDSLKIIPDSGLGILRNAEDNTYSRSFEQLHPRAKQKAHEPALLILTKSNSRATVHRPGYLDYVGIKRFDADGKVIGEWRFLGLYTSAAYIRRATDIPLLRRKVQSVMRRSGFRAHSHSQKALLNIVETLPRDELFQCTDDELYEIAHSILQLQERQRVRVIVRPDAYGRFVSILIYMPRDRFNTDIRLKVQEILANLFNARELDFTVWLTDSVLARLHLILHLPPGELPRYETEEIEKRIAATIRSWKDELHGALIHEYGEEQGNRLLQEYETAFPVSYQGEYSAEIAAHDIHKLEALKNGLDLGMGLYHPVEAPQEKIRFKLFHTEEPLSLSLLLPVLENMGLKVIDERPHRLQPAGRPLVWLHDVGMVYAYKGKLDIEQIRQIFQDAFVRIWYGVVENDGLNALVLRARLDWREVVVIRSCVKYLKQTNFPFSQNYMEQALVEHPQIARMLVDLFLVRFDPDGQAQAAERSERITDAIQRSLDEVPTLDADRILRRLFVLLQAMLRTNYFQTTDQQAPRAYLSFKLDPQKIPDLPNPQPRFEIFVYSPQTEGVHLRGDKVARGGIRWSDRQEDFRTEVFGLMKAQMVKNAVIIPVGAKGGFIVKQNLRELERDEVNQRVISCYKTFIRGLLDLTDNLIDDKPVPPPRVVSYDEPDPYLVVAADKGTASFSDTANAIAREYNFWLDDAFASGGSSGYDHKKMGITARGGWESVKRHFREIGKDIQLENFTVAGIGDMAGDVFGNGMLLSRHIHLIAAFNHKEIFLDPEPDAEHSFRERERLFNLPHSNWSDYDPTLISKGGGVYSRTAKSITLSPQVKNALQVEAGSLTPNELITAILKAPVELFWNGGIGTFVKASDESHDDADDRANDALRVNADELRCRVIGEGGNLGLTQRSRIEFARQGGRLNTDFIDNSGGVDCSDHEVNIKILLNKAMSEELLDESQRNQLLDSMTEDVARLVLINNYQQSEALSLSEHLAPTLLDEHIRLMRMMERKGLIQRETWSLPDDENLSSRRSTEQGLSRPELAVLQAFSKIDLYQELLASGVLDEGYLINELPIYFPEAIARQYPQYMNNHPLRREIIATFIANSMINRMGMAFPSRLYEHTGAPIPEIACAYLVTRKTFDLPGLWQQIALLDNRVTASVQLDMLSAIRRLANQSTLWLLQNIPRPLDIGATIDKYMDSVSSLIHALPSQVVEEDSEALAKAAQAYQEQDIPEPFAWRMAGLPYLFPALDMVEVALQTGQSPVFVAQVFNRIGAALELHWLRDQIDKLSRKEHWTRLARSALRDELYRLQRLLTASVLDSDATNTDAMLLVENWRAAQEAVLERYTRRFVEFKSASVDLALLNVALNELQKLIRNLDEPGEY
ncbi:NAD-glutamate dehydrogenase [Thiohalophilus thiocyanatoxydans]|uniref:Glutamate dehydrogenase n=1 Tax=Thiohalophilus thiocyanatoxydans TaxID=381308 RepID=A0A4R8ILQ4_9GAMM|nr:NAD-glutamate dehydrogenase [Thiohalophilus thiocyanatoxydans]TDY01742.1 glutamate dehydrogenase [Thiohalophilus thiocyanatoxydans]